MTRVMNMNKIRDQSEIKVSPFRDMDRMSSTESDEQFNVALICAEGLGSYASSVQLKTIDWRHLQDSVLRGAIRLPPQDFHKV